MKTVQASLASNAILRAISNKQEGDNEPHGDHTHRSVGVDPDFYDLVDDNIISILLDACKPLFDLVSGAAGGDSSMKPADLLMTTAKLIIAAGFKMKERARHEMAEEDLGGGMFDQDVKGMKAFASKCNDPQIYEAHEEEMLATQLADFEDTPKKLKKYKTGTKLYSVDISDTGSGVELRGMQEIRAPIEQVVSYWMGIPLQFDEYTDGAQKTTVGTRRSHHSVVVRSPIVMPNPFDDREGVVESLYKKLNARTFLVAQASCEHTDFPERAGVVRLNFTRTIKFTNVRPRLTLVEWSGTINLKGSIPRSINDAATTPAVVGSLARFALYFTIVRSADAFDEGDGTVLGRLLFLRLYPHRQNRDHLSEKTLEMIRLTNVLRSAQAKYRFFDEFLFHIVRNKMKKGGVQSIFTVKTSLAALTANEAGRIARSLVVALMTNESAHAAADELIVTYPALVQLDAEFVWFRPMLSAISAELMKEVAYGVKLRAAIGASVSFLDMISDAYMIFDFFNTNRSGTAMSLLAMVLANLLYQMLVVYAQTQGLEEDKWKTILVEILGVVTFVKPGMDAYRVASGAEKRKGAAADALAEMAYTKVGELCFEAIPGLVLQLIALLRAKQRSKVAIVSVLISAASGALTATSMSYDTDTDPGARKRNPEWCGLIPNIGRTQAFVTAFFISYLQIIAKCTAVALLAVTNINWLVYYFAADHLLHFVYRIARRDFIWYVASPTVAAYCISPIYRIMCKVATDFTGCLLIRLPLLCGGAYFFASLVVSQMSVFVCVHVYSTVAVAEDGVDKIEADTLWRGASALAGAWLLTFVYFVFRIVVPKYRHTLWSSTSGRLCVHEYFLKGKTDEDKFEIFGCNLILWERDIGEEVKVWSLANWERWVEEEAALLNRFGALVPDEYIPPRFLAEMGPNRERRGGAASSVRESMRRGSFAEE